MPRRWYEFGPFRLDPDAGLVVRGNTLLRLTPKAVDTLRVLVENAGRVVSKATLLAEVWPATFVQEGSLARNISDLRKALTAGSERRRYIETIPKRGYRFASPVLEPKPHEEIFGRTVTVLPLRGVGDDRRLSRLGLGITDAVTAKLSRVRGCVVRPSALTSSARPRRVDPLDAARQLAVELAIDGTVQRSGRRIRVIARLFEATTGSLSWGETFEEERGDMLARQDSIAEQIAGAVALWLGGGGRQLRSRRTTQNSDAYALYLRGRFEWSQRSTASLHRSIKWFRRATAKDPEYALAYSGLAASRALLPMIAPVPPRTSMPRARAAAVHALDIDESLTEARATLAFVKWHYDWDWAGAEREFLRIRKFHGGDAVTSQWFALMLAEQGRATEAIAEARRARRLEPRSAATLANVATVSFFVGRRSDAIDQARQALALSAASMRAHLILGLALEQAGKLDDAIAELERAWELGKRNPGILGALAHAYASSGRTRALDSLLHGVERAPAGQPWSYARALAAVGAGRLEQALVWLERAYEDKDFLIAQVKVDRRLDPLRRNPRFERLQKKVGLSDRA